MQKTPAYFFFFFFIFPLCFSQLFAKEARTSFQEDREIKAISNLKYVEPTSKYTTRKVEQIQRELDAIQKKFVEIEMQKETETKKQGLDSILSRIAHLEVSLEKLADTNRIEQLEERLGVLEKRIETQSFLTRAEFEARMKSFQSQTPQPLQAEPVSQPQVDKSKPA